MGKYRINEYLLMIAVIIFLDLRCFYLVDTEVIPVEDIVILLQAAFAVYVYWTCGRWRKARYSVIFIVPVILVFTSAYMAYVNYGQPLFMGIRAQRHWIVALLMYFPLSCLIKSGKVRIDQLFKLLDPVMFVYCVLVLAQWILGERFMFMYVLNNLRYGSIRLYISTYLLLISYFYHLYLFLEKKKLNARDLFFIIVTIFIQLFVKKSRMELLALIGASAFAWLSMKTTARKILYAGLVLLAGCVFICTSMGKTVLDSVLSASSNIREVGRQFYIETTFSSPLSAIFGSGYANIDWEPTVIGIRYLDKIYYNDNGIIGLFFYYGLAFVFWTLLSHIKIMWDAWKSHSRNMFFYLLCGLLGMYTLFPHCYVTDISFALVCAVIDASMDTRPKTGIPEAVRREIHEEKEHRR